MPQQGISSLSVHRTMLNQLSHFDRAFPHSLYSHVSLQHESQKFLKECKKMEDFLALMTLDKTFQNKILISLKN